MGEAASPGQCLRAAAAALTLAVVIFFASGCAARSYADISFAPGAADAEAQTLARRAQAGDKQAQLELGIRYEEGRAVRVSPAQAEWLYSRAATDTGGMQLVYVPVAGPRGRGQTIPFHHGPIVAGLPEARERLAAIRTRRRDR